MYIMSERISYKPGMKFGMLTLIEPAPDQVSASGKHKKVWVCRCDCGNYKNVTATHLKDGHTTSCGCLNSKLSSQRITERNTIHNLSRHPIYIVYDNMINRCFNKNNGNYNIYGGRGITIWANVTVKDYAAITAIGCDREGLYLGGHWTLDIAEHATLTAKDNIGYAINTNGFNVKGKGKLIANEAGKNGINIESGTLTLDGAEVEAKGGANNAAILATGNLAVTANLVKLTTTAGTGSTICISKDDAEAKKADIGTADEKKFNDAVKDGVRTITPIPAEE